MPVALGERLARLMVRLPNGLAGPTCNSYLPAKYITH
jgi:hypothetical protein